MSEIEPPPSLTKTYRWHDGGDVMGEFTWMVDIDGFEAEMDFGDDPRQVLIETWERTNVEVRWLFPPHASCIVEDGEGNPCEDDAVCWARESGHWHPLCAEHKNALAADLVLFLDGADIGSQGGSDV